MIPVCIYAHNLHGGMFCGNFNLWAPGSVSEPLPCYSCVYTRLLPVPGRKRHTVAHRLAHRGVPGDIPKRTNGHAPAHQGTLSGAIKNAPQRMLRSAQHVQKRLGGLGCLLRSVCVSRSATWSAAHQADLDGWLHLCTGDDNLPSQKQTTYLVPATEPGSLGGKL